MTKTDIYWTDKEAEEIAAIIKRGLEKTMRLRAEKEKAVENENT